MTAEKSVAARRGKRVVVLGAGFAGLFAVVEFEKLCGHVPELEVTLVDRYNYHMFVPLLYHVATGGADGECICFAIRSLLRNGGAVPPVLFRESEVLGIDLSTRTVATDHGDLGFDYLVLALGSTSNYYGIPGVGQNIIPLKTIQDGVALHNRILESFEAAIHEPDEDRRRALLTFVVVGGGATGAELCSTMALFVFKTLPHDFPTLASQARVVLVEATDSLLRGMRPALGRMTLARLEKMGVEVMLNCHVAAVSKEGIAAEDGRHVATRNVVWVAGIKLVPLADGLPVEKAKDGRIIVNEYLEVPSAPGLYVVGDSAYALQRGTATAYPPTAQSAVRMGRTCGRNVVAAMIGSSPRRFDYHYKGDIVFLGRNYAVGEFLGQVISGFPAFFLYQAYHLVSLMGFRKKIITLIDWAYDYFYSRSTEKV